MEETLDRIDDTAARLRKAIHTLGDAADGFASENSILRALVSRAEAENEGLRRPVKDMIKTMEGACKPYRYDGLDEKTRRYIERARLLGVEYDTKG